MASTMPSTESVEGGRDTLADRKKEQARVADEASAAISAYRVTGVVDNNSRASLEYVALLLRPPREITEPSDLEEPHVAQYYAKFLPIYPTKLQYPTFDFVQETDGLVRPAVDALDSLLYPNTGALDAYKSLGPSYEDRLLEHAADILIGLADDLRNHPRFVL